MPRMIRACLLAAAVGTGWTFVAASIPQSSAAGAHASAARPTPWSIIRRYMRRTYELGRYADPHFGAFSGRAVVSDGHGGSLTAVVGLRRPSADAKGQLVFFFHNRRFLGWDSNRESIQIQTGGGGWHPALRRHIHALRVPRCAVLSVSPPSQDHVSLDGTAHSLKRRSSPPKVGPHLRSPAPSALSPSSRRSQRSSRLL